MIERTKKFTIAWLLVCAGCLIAANSRAQQAPLNPSGAAAEISASAPAANCNATITIPAGTNVPLTLATPISSRARRGHVVRALTAFPVTVGSRIAIPSDTYLNGVITKLDKFAPAVTIRFSRLIFANGYSVPINGVSSPYVASLPAGASAPLAGFFGGHVPPPDTFPGQTITPPPLPHSGPTECCKIS